MKKNQSKRIARLLLVVLFIMMGTNNIIAQTKVADKEIIGVWIMVSMKYEGENKEFINDLLPFRNF